MNRCEGEDIIVVGGGNSAGQAAVFLFSGGARVTILVRGEVAARTGAVSLRDDAAIQLVHKVLAE